MRSSNNGPQPKHQPDDVPLSEFEVMWRRHDKRMELAEKRRRGVPLFGEWGIDPAVAYGKVNNILVEALRALDTARQNVVDALYWQRQLGRDLNKALEDEADKT